MTCSTIQDAYAIQQHLIYSRAFFNLPPYILIYIFSVVESYLEYLGSVYTVHILPTFAVIKTGTSP
jgi:hypothetical protein